MTETFILPLAKTDTGLSLINTIHNNLYHGNETKTNRFDNSLAQNIIFKIYCENKYDTHIRIMKIPTRIRDRCTIAYNDNLVECIYLIPNVLDDPENTDVEFIEEMLYDDVKKYVQNIIDHFESIKSEKRVNINETKAHPPSPVTRPATPIEVDDIEIFNQYATD